MAGSGPPDTVRSLPVLPVVAASVTQPQQQQQNQHHHRSNRLGGSRSDSTHTAKGAARSGGCPKRTWMCAAASQPWMADRAAGQPPLRAATPYEASALTRLHAAQQMRREWQTLCRADHGRTTYSQSSQISRHLSSKTDNRNPLACLAAATPTTPPARGPRVTNRHPGSTPPRHPSVRDHEVRSRRPRQLEFRSRPRHRSHHQGPHQRLRLQRPPPPRFT
jgi:hypothetical protein